MFVHVGQKLSPEELVDKLNEGGWFVTGGRKFKELPAGPILLVRSASFFGGAIGIQTVDENHRVLFGNGGKHLFEVVSDDIALVNSCTIKIRNMATQKLQRKKVDGGGWYEVPVVGLTLLLSHEATKADIQRKKEEDCRRWDEERKLRDAKEAEEEKERERQRVIAVKEWGALFLARLEADFSGKKLVKFEGFEGAYPGVRLIFEDGSQMEITTNDWIWRLGRGSACVHGYSLQDFKGCWSVGG